MADERHHLLIIEPLASKYDRIYKAKDGETDEVYEVNLAHLSCTCPEFLEKRAGFLPDDARRICVHVLEKLYSTKVERTFNKLLQLFVRYGRRMYSYRVAGAGDLTCVLGQPFGPMSLRAIGIVNEGPLLATYNFRSGEWSDGETPLTPEIYERVLNHMRAVFPDAWWSGSRPWIEGADDPELAF